MPTGFQIVKQEAAHYLTLQVVYWVDLFSRQRYRDIIIDSLNYCISKKNLIVFGYVIMSNHVHLLVQAENANLSDVIRDFKKYSSGRILFSIQNESESRREWMLKLFEHAASQHKRNVNFQVWTHENHAEEIYSNQFTLQKIKYIHDNPVRSGIVKHAEDYLYSSAGNYADEKGLVDVTVLSLHSLMIQYAETAQSPPALAYSQDYAERGYIAALEIFDTKGNKLRYYSLSSNQTTVEIDMTNESAGFYFCRFTSNDKIVLVDKVVISK